MFEFVQLQLIFTRLTAGKISFTPYIPLSFPTLTLTLTLTPKPRARFPNGFEFTDEIRAIPIAK